MDEGITPGTLRNGGLHPGERIPGPRWAANFPQSRFSHGFGCQAWQTGEAIFQVSRKADKLQFFIASGRRRTAKAILERRRRRTMMPKEYHSKKREGR